MLGLWNNQKRSEVEYFFRFEQAGLLGITLPLVIIGIIARYWLARPIYFHHALASTLKAKQFNTMHPYQKFFYSVHLFVFILLALLVAKPQLVDARSNSIVEGIDIMLVLDASGSMNYRDYSDDDRSRFIVAKQEALRFIDKRVNDAIGLVLFGKYALSRSPLTMDKIMLHEIVNELKIGEIDPAGTMLATGMVTAINRLKHSDCSSKIMIVLTDGEPSPGDIDVRAAIEIAKKFDIKIYTIGIGNNQDGYFLDPIQGIMPKPKVNEPLLQKISRETGGSFFMAHNARDMRSIYATIDRLEKKKHEVPLYSRYVDIFAPFVLMIIILLGLQQLLSAFVWFGL